MAIRTDTQELPVNGYVLSSALRLILYDTGLPDLRVTLSVTEGKDTVVLYENTLHAYGGKVELFGADTVIEQYMRSKNLSLLKVKIYFGQSSVPVNVVYCEYDMPVGFDCMGLLVSSTAQRVRHDSSFVMAAVNHDASARSVRFDIVGHNSEGQLETVSFIKFGTASLFTDMTFNVADIVRSAFLMPDCPIVDVLYFAASMGGLQKMCYIVPSPAYLTFSFRNLHNVREYLDVEGSVSAKTESTRNFAVCAGDTLQYDRRITRTYEVRTAPVPRSEIAMYEQMITSHKLELCIPSEHAYAPVIITDHKCEPDTDDSDLVSMQFSFRFIGNRPRAFDSLAFGIMPERRQIFTEQFSEPYE